MAIEPSSSGIMVAQAFAFGALLQRTNPQSGQASKKARIVASSGTALFGDQEDLLPKYIETAPAINIQWQMHPRSAPRYLKRIIYLSA